MLTCLKNGLHSEFCFKKIILSLLYFLFVVSIFKITWSTQKATATDLCQISSFPGFCSTSPIHEIFQSQIKLIQKKFKNIKIKKEERKEALLTDFSFFRHSSYD